MHISTPSDKAPVADTSGVPWYRELNRTHWFVLVVASLGWLFDTMDQQLFNLARRPAIVDLVGGATVAGTKPIAEYAGYATMVFMIGWASGGLIFGILGDRIGRVRTMIFTILCYSLFTGLSAFSVGLWDFAFYRFITPALGPHLPHVLPHIRDGLIVCGVFGVVYFVVAMIAGVPEARATLSRFKKR